MVVRNGDYGTVSSTLIALGVKPRDAIYQFSNGAPDQSKYEDFSPMLRDILSRGLREARTKAKAQGLTTAWVCPSDCGFSKRLVFQACCRFPTAVWSFQASGFPQRLRFPSDWFSASVGWFSKRLRFHKRLVSTPKRRRLNKSPM